MATFGSFADLSQAQADLAQRRRTTGGDPLNALIQGLTQGVELQQLPAQIQQQALMNQLKAQLMQQSVDQGALRLESLRRAVPTEMDSAINQAMQEIKARQLGIFAAPQVTGRPTSLPALPVSEAAQRAILATPEGTPFVEESISPLEVPVQLSGGRVFDPQSFRSNQQQAAEQKILESSRKLRSDESIKQEFELERIEKRNESRGFKTYINPADPTDILNLSPTERPPEGFMEAKTYLASVKQSGSRGAGGGGGLKPTGEEINKFASGLNVLKQANKTLAIAGKYEKEGTFPGSFQIGLADFLSTPPEENYLSKVIPGFSSIYTTVQNLARGAQTGEAQDVQMRKAVIMSTILRTQAGLSQTLGEKINITPYVPTGNDTYASLVRKLKLTIELGNDALEIQRRIFPSLADIPAPELENSSDTSTSSDGTNYRSAEEAIQKGNKVGSIVTINGVPSIITPD